jgi:hypothetical protein
MIFLLFVLLSVSLFQDYPLEDGIPTRKGIERYIADMGDSLVMEYQHFIQDSLYDILVYTDDFGRYSAQDSLELGWYYMGEVIISSDARFLGYELNDLSKRDRALHAESNKFVKSTVFHELTHHYLHIIEREMYNVDSIFADPAYRSGLRLVRWPAEFGATFIEEGLCEYQCGKMGEIIVPKKPFIPRTIEELTGSMNRYDVTYKYAAHYLETFLDTTGFKKGVKILLYNSPPSFEEILNPELFFQRLEMLP